MKNWRDIYFIFLVVLTLVLFLVLPWLFPSTALEQALRDFY